MLASGIVILVYGPLVLAGGVMAWVKAKSKPSLIAGGISGIILLGAGALVIGGRTEGAVLAAGMAVVLVLMFGVRLARGARPMPAIPIIVLSIIGFGAALLVLLGG